MINVVTKLMPVAAKTLGWKGALELAATAGILAEGLNLAIDKGGSFVKSKLDGKLEEQKTKLEEKKTALLQQKAAEAEKKITVITEGPKDETPVEEKPKSTSKKKNK